MDDLQDGQTCDVRLPKRSLEYGIGKQLGGKVYVHRQYANQLGALIEAARPTLPADFDYIVVKFNSLTGDVSFITSPDFDTADEPVVGDVITVKPDGASRRRDQRADPQIYHHKWLFVADDYKGFNVAASKRRSATWLKLAEIDKSRIGTKSYWEEHVVPRIGS
jgi:hypothetical protein